MVKLVGTGTAHWIDNTQVVDSRYGQKDQKGQNADSVVFMVGCGSRKWAIIYSKRKIVRGSTFVARRAGK
jgi:hypothetical protein